MSYLVDTNIFLRVANPADPRRAECVAVLDLLRGAEDDSFTCAQVLIEYWVTATRPTDVNGLGLDAAQSARNLDLMVSMFPCLPEPSDMAQRWRQVVEANGVLGKPAHDARLVALMQAHGISNILTLNVNDFTRYQEITPITPAEVLNQ